MDSLESKRRTAFKDTPIVKDMRETAKELGITEKIRDVLNASGEGSPDCHPCPACRRLLTEALAELLGPK